MGRGRVPSVTALVALCWAALPAAGAAQEQPVRMVLFFSPTCRHCE